MEQNITNQHIGAQTAINNSLENARFIQKVYSWMTIGLLLTAIVAYFVAITPEAINLIFSSR